MVSPHDYSISVRRGIFEGEVCFEATIKEFPDIAEYADSFEEAYSLAIDSIEVTMEVFESKGKSVPQPYIAVADFSGRVTLRLPKSLHRSLAIMSDTEGVSLNQYLCNVLSYHSGFAKHSVTKTSSGIYSRSEQSVRQESI